MCGSFDVMANNQVNLAGFDELANLRALVHTVGNALLRERLLAYLDALGDSAKVAATTPTETAPACAAAERSWSNPMKTFAAVVLLIVTVALVFPAIAAAPAKDPPPPKAEATPAPKVADPAADNSSLEKRLRDASTDFGKKLADLRDGLAQNPDAEIDFSAWSDVEWIGSIEKGRKTLVELKAVHRSVSDLKDAVLAEGGKQKGLLTKVRDTFVELKEACETKLASGEDLTPEVQAALVDELAGHNAAIAAVESATKSFSSMLSQHQNAVRSILSTGDMLDRLDRGLGGFEDLYKITKDFAGLKAGMEQYLPKLNQLIDLYAEIGNLVNSSIDRLAPPKAPEPTLGRLPVAETIHS